MTTELTAEYAREHLEYNEETGQLFWRVARQGRVLGKPIGTINSLGYSIFRLDGKIYYTHRVIWLIAHGKFPPEHIDHINGNRADNRLLNLRLASHSMNLHNCEKSKNNTTGYKGVSFHKQTGKFMVQICSQRRRMYLGLFECPEKGYAAYVKKDQELHGEYARVS